MLTPTRELAVQIADNAAGYGKFLPLRSGVVYGGVPMPPQQKMLLAGVEILIATPGRLLDHAGSKTVNLSQVSILVLDEADRMLDMGFMPDLKRILALIPKQRQSLLFSATFSEPIRALAQDFLRVNHFRIKMQLAARNTRDIKKVINQARLKFHVPADDLERLVEPIEDDPEALEQVDATPQLPELIFESPFDHVETEIEKRQQHVGLPRIRVADVEAKTGVLASRSSRESGGCHCK